MKIGNSIRLKISFWSAVLLVLAVGLSFLAVRFSSGLVLRSINREYLIDAVEKNVGMIRFAEAQDHREANSYIPYKNGFLEIDEDFLKEMGGVFAALYDGEGTLLYGEDPLARQTGTRSFRNTGIWYAESGGETYILYDRSIRQDQIGDLWLRGMVSETKSLAPLASITRLSLILLPILILLAVLALYLVTDRMLKPLKDVETAAGDIARGDKLDRRIEGIRTEDEVGQLAATFNQMMEKLEASFEREKQFTSDASHELRTPTSVILAQTEYTLEKERSAEEYREALEVVHKQGERMSALIRDMLDYSRMDLSAERYPLTPLNLSELVRETADALAPVGDSPLQYRVELEENVQIKGNENLLSRLLQNLISNAYRYGDPEGKIRICLERKESGVILSVEDDGPGIPREEQEKIFERFYRSDSSRNAQGTGLGLALVKKIAQIHGAEVWLESEEDRGSRFIILFPVFF
ncbi:MAG: HAMP domain-containing histidine kinase [Firmicutes bacterium]|nr:HAMP domain-containing histidine kinase [Lachnospiraceae bacterium]MBQ7059482.1 HAMP domain-containing histidine kinase [Bacillota bacterium]